MRSTLPAKTDRATPGRAFTLIEMVAVVGITAVLTAILLPSLIAARQHARRITCASNLRATGNAFQLLRTEHGRYPDMGDYNPLGVFGSQWRRGMSKPTRWTLTNIADLAEPVVYKALGKPDQLYCPASFRDPRNPAPYQLPDGRRVDVWRNGDISYIYLAGIRQGFEDANGVPTFNVAYESPDREVNKVNPRAVLLGDRTVELQPGKRNLPSSNHGREGGWFYYTDGELRWHPWKTLTAHPAPTYVWYWPRTGRSADESQNFLQ